MAWNHSSPSTHSHRGTTLIELVVSIGLFVGLVGLTTTMTIDAWDTYFSLRGQAALIGDLSRTGDRMATLLATATALPATVTIAGTAYTAGDQTLIATIPSVDASGSALAGSHDTLVYAQSGNGLVEVLDANGGVRADHRHTIIEGSLVSIQFQVAAASVTQAQPTATVTLVGSAQLPHRTIQRTESRVMVLRNLP